MLTVPIDFLSIEKNTMEVNGYRQHVYKLWLNIHFWVNYPFNTFINDNINFMLVLKQGWIKVPQAFIIFMSPF